MAHPKAEEFKNYYWVERFYMKMVQTLGQARVNSLETDIEHEAEQEYVKRRDAMLDAGWTEEARGVYTCPMPVVDENSERYKAFKEKFDKDFEEFKRKKAEEMDADSK